MARILASRGSAAALLALLAFLAGCDDKMLPGVDFQPPEAEISQPPDGAVVSGVSFVVEVAATDDTGVDRVVFRVNGLTALVDSEAPFSAALVTLDRAAGADLVVEAEAFDAAGNSATATAAYEVRARTTTRLTNNPTDDMNPAWSPDGTRIAFQSKRNGDQFDLWWMNADGSGATRLTQDVNEDRNPAWSPDGEWIAFDSDRVGTFDVWRLPLAGGEAAAVAVTFANLDDVEPAWTPDGTTLYFASNRGSNAPFNIWRILVGDDADAEQLTSFDVDDRAPAVSSDGTRLAFASSLNFGLPHVFTTEIGSDTVTPLTGDVGTREGDPMWLPGRSLVAFSRDDGIDSNLWYQSTTEVVPTQATFGSGTLGDGGAAWSPDGSKLAFHSDRDGNLEIYVME